MEEVAQHTRIFKIVDLQQVQYAPGNIEVTSDIEGELP